MSQVNNFLIKRIILALSIVILIVVSIIYLPIFKNDMINDGYTLQSDTLFYTGKNTSDNPVLYLLMEYKYFKKDSIYIKRSTVRKEGVSNFYRYFMIIINDSLVLIKPVKKDEQDSDSMYIDLRKGKIAHVDYFLNRLNSELQFAGYEQYENRNGKCDSLIVMYGCDINQGPCFEEYKNYWYFDKNFHLRKAVSTNGIVFFMDKHYFGIE